MKRENFTRMKKGNYMKNKTKILLAVLSLCIVVITAAAVVILYTVFVGKKSTDNGKYISRYDWMKKLCENMGATEYSEKTPYFEDVDTDNEYFAYVQSAVEWNYIEADGKFDGENAASGRQIALTAMKSVGESKLQIYLGDDSDLTDNDYLKLALDNGLMGDGDLDRRYTPDEAQTVIDKLDSLYYGEFWPEDLEKITYKDDVIQLSDSDVEEYSSENETLQISDSSNRSLKSGDVVVFDTNGAKIARKIGDTADGGAFNLEIPELEDVVDSMIESHIQKLGFQDIVDYYGEDNLIEANAGGGIAEATPVLAKVFEGQVTDEGFELELVGNDEDNLEIYITDKSQNKKYKLPIKETHIEDAKNFDVKISVEDMMLGMQADFGLRKGLKYAELGFDVTINSSFGLAGTIGEKKIHLLTIPEQIGAVTVNVEISIVISVDGEFSLSAEIPTGVGFAYEKGKGFRKVSRGDSPELGDLNVDCSVTPMLRTTFMIIPLGLCPILDADLDIGAGVEAEATSRPTGMTCINVNFAMPLMKLTVGNEDNKYHGMESLLAKAGLSVEWELLNFDNALLKKEFHFECYADESVKRVDECTYNADSAEVDSEEETTQTSETSDDKTTEEQTTEVISSGESDDVDSVKLTNTYTTKYGSQHGVPQFAFDYPDGWTLTDLSSNQDAEMIRIENSSGISVDYRYMLTHMSSAGMVVHKINVSKAYDMKYKCGDVEMNGETVDATLEFDNLIVARFDHDGGSYGYAVVDKSMTGAREEVSSYEACLCREPDTIHLEFSGFIPKGTEISDKDEKELLAILSSFRIAGADAAAESGVTEEEMYEMLKRGDYSYFAGTYSPLGQQEYESSLNEYSEAPYLSDIILDNHGVITGDSVLVYIKKYGHHEIEPEAVSRDETGGFKCDIDTIETKPGDPEYEAYSRYHYEYFVIYPAGVYPSIISNADSKDGPSFLDAIDSETQDKIRDGVCICFVSGGGGGVPVSELYYKID